MKREGSNLVSRTGIAILAVALLGAAYLRITALEALLAAALLLCLAAYGWGKSALKKISVDIRQQECSAFPGEIMESDASLRNGKLLPVIWLEARFPTGPEACVAEAHTGELAAEEAGENEDEDMPPAIGESFLWVMPHQSISWKQQALAVHRGVCEIDHMELSSGDGFGLTEQSCPAQLPVGFRFVVFPKLLEVDVGPILRHMSELETAPRGLYTDRTLICNIHDYRDGDSFRDINWRMLARQGKLQTNVHEQMTMRRVCLLLNLGSFAYTEYVQEQGERIEKRHVYREELEQMFSLAASCVLRLSDAGVLCSVVIPAIGSVPERIVLPESSREQPRQLLTALAEVAYGGEKTAIPTVRMEEEHHLLGQLFVLTRTAEDTCPELEQAQEELGFFRIVQQGGREGESRIIRETDMTQI